MSKKAKWKVVQRYLTRSSKDPESLARGVGLGLFVGLLPSIGFQIILAFFLAGFLNANRIVAMLGTLVTNPFTALPMSAFSLWFGDLILPGSALAKYSVQNFEWKVLMNSPSELLLAYIVGCFALSLIAGTIGYGSMRLYCARIKAIQTGISKARE